MRYDTQTLFDFPTIRISAQGPDLGITPSTNLTMHALHLLALFLSVTIATPLHPRPSLYPNAAPINMASWQSLLPNTTFLSSLSIPGTHDTMAYRKSRRNLLPLFTQTQKNDLLTQLRNGVRYLDLRLQHHQNRFTIHHGVAYLRFDLPEVLSIIETFLASEGGQESLIVRVACNNCYHGGGQKGQNGNTREFWETMVWYVYENSATSAWFDRWALWIHQTLRQRTIQDDEAAYYTPKPTKQEGSNRGPGKGVPTLGEARGKVTFIQNFASELGFFPLFWTVEEDVLLQDEWTVTSGQQLARKLRNITELWERTAEWDHSTRCPLVVNHLSASSWAWWPVDVARAVYKALFVWMKMGWDEGGGRPMGIVVGDYVSAAVCRVIVEKNFLKGGAGQEMEGMVDFEWELWKGGWTQEKASSKGKGGWSLFGGRGGGQIWKSCRRNWSCRP
jgi:1-phosphatidylinositol phosphodiesterase